MGVAARVSSWKRWGLRNPAGPLAAAGPLGTRSGITFPTTMLAVQVRIALGADLSADPATWSWEEITGYVRHATAINITAWSQDESSTTTPSAATLVLDNRDGRFSRRNPIGAYYGLLGKNTPIWIAVDPGNGMHTRYEGHVTAWPNRWDMSGRDATVGIECAGVLRRLGQGSRSMSALRRTILAADPEAYWPLEEEAGAEYGLSAVGGLRLIDLNVDWGAFTDLTSATQTPGMESASLIANMGIAGLTDVGGWHVEFAIKSGFVTPLVARITTGSATNPTMEIFYPSVAGDTIEVTLLDAAGATVDTMAGPAVAAAFVDEWHHIAIVAEQVLAVATFTLWVDGVHVATCNGTGASTISEPRRVHLNPSLAAVTSMAHLVVANGQDLTGYTAFTGHVGEQAHIRIERLCAEEGVGYYSMADSSVTMGPQPVGTILAVVRDAEAADHGTLYERNWGLAYASLRERENQASSIALNLDDDLVDPPEPNDDDQRTRNIWTVTRTNGAEATVEHTSGPMGTGPDGPGRYDDSATINVERDRQAVVQAGFLLTLGTVDEDRWPHMSVGLHNSPDLIDDVTAMVPGSRVTAVSPPDQMAPDTVDAIVEGYTETFDWFIWDVTLNTSPYSPYHVFRLAEMTGDTDVYVGYAVPATCVLAEDLDTTETGVNVTTTGELWSTAADDWTPGALITVGGEDMRVTAVSGASNPQTLTVVRSVNGVVKTHNTAATVEFKSPGVLGL